MPLSVTDRMRAMALTKDHVITGNGNIESHLENKMNYESLWFNVLIKDQYTGWTRVYSSKSPNEAIKWQGPLSDLDTRLEWATYRVTRVDTRYRDQRFAGNIEYGIVTAPGTLVDTTVESLDSSML
jgi:hypothetical protein